MCHPSSRCRRQRKKVLRGDLARGKGQLRNRRSLKTAPRVHRSLSQRAIESMINGESRSRSHVFDLPRLFPALERTWALGVRPESFFALCICRDAATLTFFVSWLSSSELEEFASTLFSVKASASIA